MDENNRNFILAIVLSLRVRFGWQYFFVPKHPPQQQPGQQTAEQQQQQQQQAQKPAEPGPPQPRSERGAPPPAGMAGQVGGAQAATETREQALASSPRVAIDT